MKPCPHDWERIVFTPAPLGEHGAGPGYEFALCLLCASLRVVRFAGNTTTTAIFFPDAPSVV